MPETNDHPSGKKCGNCGHSHLVHGTRPAANEPNNPTDGPILECRARPPKCLGQIDPNTKWAEPFTAIWPTVRVRTRACGAFWDPTARAEKRT